ncbi:MAG TPA: protein jag [Candidatus Hydrogenedentes bacterium]|nr:protein jag [Candidatus Hydrogenedentota bacterium]
MRVIESSGKTREEAIQNGLKELGVDMHDLEKIDVIDEGSKGFLGLGARPVRVRLTAERANEPRQKRGDGKKERPERRDTSRREQRGGKQEQRKEGQQERSRKGGRPGDNKPNRDGDVARSERQEGQRRKKKRKRSGGGEYRPEDNRAPAQNRAQQGNAHKASPIIEKQHRSVTDEATEALRRAQNFENADAEGADNNVMDNDLPPDARTDEEIETITDEQGREAAAMLSEVLALMDLKGNVTFARAADGSARLAIDSEEDGGILIGKRGVTLHAIQYLVNRMIAQNEAGDNTERVVVDVGGYVDRRQNMLADMARSMAKRAKETGRNVRLKPLSPQERRIIHLTLEPDPQVRTYSLGDSLFRSIVINPVGGKDGGPKRRNSERRERNRDDGGGPKNE